MKIIKVIGKKTTSNTWVLINPEYSENKCILIDANEDAFTCLVENNLVPEAIFLTHEHYDHCCGVLEILPKFNCYIFCSEECAVNIGDKRKNLSFYKDSIGFEIKTNVKIIKNNEKKSFLGKNFVFYYMKGHSPGSVCICVNKYLFTGDSYMNQFKTPTKTPGTNLEELIQTQNRIKKLISDNDFYVLCGHGI